jgi:hypothetical protein
MSGANEWAKIIASVQSGEIENVPEEYKTVNQLCVELKLPKTTIYERITKLKTLGKIEETKFRIKAGSRVYLSPHYKIIK